MEEIGESTLSICATLFRPMSVNTSSERLQRAYVRDVTTRAGFIVIRGGPLQVDRFKDDAAIVFAYDTEVGNAVEALRVREK